MQMAEVASRMAFGPNSHSRGQHSAMLMSLRKGLRAVACEISPPARLVPLTQISAAAHFRAAAAARSSDAAAEAPKRALAMVCAALMRPPARDQQPDALAELTDSDAPSTNLGGRVKRRREFRPVFTLTHRLIAPPRRALATERTFIRRTRFGCFPFLAPSHKNRWKLFAGSSIDSCSSSPSQWLRERGPGETMFGRERTRAPMSIRPCRNHVIGLTS